MLTQLKEKGKLNKKYALVLVIVVVLACVLMVPAHAQLSVSIGPTAATIDVGESESFSSTVTGGSGNYSFQWYLSGTTVSGATSPSWTFTPQSMRSYVICLMVKDLSTGGIEGSQPNATMTVNTALSISISPTSVALDVGQSQIFTATASGGTLPYEYYWSLNKGSFSGPFTSPSWTFTPSTKGSYNVTCKVTDSSTPDIGPTWPKSIAPVVTVNPPPTVSISPTSVALDVGQSLGFTAYAQNGTTPYTYQWCLNNAAVSGATSSSWTFTPSAAGSYSVYVNVTDSVSFRVKSNVATATVNVVPSVSISPSTATVAVNQSQTFTASVTGGTSPYVYLWGVGSTLTSALLHLRGPIGSTWTITFNSTGSYVVACVVEDSSVGSPAEAWIGSASVSAVVGYYLYLSANMTIPGLTFTVNGKPYNASMLYPSGSCTITVSPTSYVVAKNSLYETIDAFVGWATSATITSGSIYTATITINLTTNTSLVAGYTLEFAGKVHPD
jgi:hypothetical protein